MHRGNAVPVPAAGNGVAGGMRYGSGSATPQHGRRTYPVQPNGTSPMLPSQHNTRTQAQPRQKKKRFADKLIPANVSTVGAFSVTLHFLVFRHHLLAEQKIWFGQ